MRGHQHRHTGRERSLEPHLLRSQAGRVTTSGGTPELAELRHLAAGPGRGRFQETRNVCRSLECHLLARIRTDACFHFGFQPSITQEHLPSPTVRLICPKGLFWMTVGDPGCRIWRTENPRVGGSIPPLATNKSGSVPGTSVTDYSGRYDL